MENAASFRGIILWGAALLAAGCSARDPATNTPSFHVGTPTNRSTVQSWELNSEPIHTQPGVNAGSIVGPLPPGQRQRGFEPYDPLAVASYNALLAAQTVDTKYITCTAKSGVVAINGSVQNDQEKQRVEQIVRGVSGVKEVRSKLRIVIAQ
ncbi:hypothetical protein CCAX7_11890 [Capsulimonas corticalis]|uniref:Uncharacterized protein n=1 Tax=Capsulimonas corticalis TaxID=2219043 RepID=A0A402D4K8_9BACT|nr:BON domain-containing protein [Capsulimonas corticalis]BDI29138.1 hypothetical protein CCAX7_11890 [Capsulimonas corticalis]